MTSHQDVAVVVAELRNFGSGDALAFVNTSKLAVAATILEAQAKALSEADNARERMWCTACGTVTRDGVCDCNRYGQDREPNFVNYADQNHKDLLEECQRTEALEARALAAEALLAESEAERDALTHDIDRHIKIASENEALLAEARKVIEPFGILASAYFSKYETRPGEFVESYSGKPDAEPIFTFNGTPITYGHLRAARAFTNTAKETT